MPDELNDGDIAHGSRTLTINGVTYVAENWQPASPSKEILSYDEEGKPRGSVGLDDFVTGSATLQLPASNAAVPQRHMTFASPDDDGVEKTWAIRSRGKVEQAGAEKKVNITFIQKYN